MSQHYKASAGTKTNKSYMSTGRAENAAVKKIHSVTDLAGVGSMFSEIVLYTSTSSMAKTSIFVAEICFCPSKCWKLGAKTVARTTVPLRPLTCTKRHCQNPNIRTSDSKQMLATQLNLQRRLPWCARLTREFSKKPLPWSRQLTNKMEMRGKFLKPLVLLVLNSSPILETNFQPFLCGFKLSP